MESILIVGETITLQQFIKNMVINVIDEMIKSKVHELLTSDRSSQGNVEFIETDNIGEVIEKLIILHCRIWYLEDAISYAKNDNEIADIKKKLDTCFKVKRPKYVQAINQMIENSIKYEKSLIEDSVKHYKGFNNE